MPHACLALARPRRHPMVLAFPLMDTDEHRVQDSRPAMGTTVTRDEMSYPQICGVVSLQDWMGLQRVCSFKNSCSRARSAGCSSEPEHIGVTDQTPFLETNLRAIGQHTKIPPHHHKSPVHPPTSVILQRSSARRRKCQRLTVSSKNTKSPKSAV